MLQYKRLLFILFIVIVLTIGFLSMNALIYGVDHSFSNRFEKQETDVQSEIQNANPVPEGSVHRYTVLYAEESQSDQTIFQNICEAADIAKLQYNTITVAMSSDLTNTDTLIIACREFINGISAKTIADYVIGGGKVLFAAGLSENTMSSYLYPVCGLVERGSFYNPQDLKVQEGFFPTGELTFKGNVLPMSSVSVRLNDECEVFVNTADGNPIIWTHEYRGGQIGFINSNMLEDRAAIGFFIAALAAAEEDFVYPVIGTSAVFIDGYPTGSENSSQMLLDYYGRNSEGFVRDILWPALLKKSMDNNFRFTAFFMGLAGYDTTTQMLNQRNFAYNAKEIVRYGGEIAVGGDQSQGDPNYTGLAGFVQGTMKSVFSNYNIYCYAPVYGKLKDEDLVKLDGTFSHLSVIRGTYFGDENTQTVQKFEYKDGIVRYPYITSGFYSTDRSRLEYYSLLTAYGAVSHTFNVVNLINPSGDQDYWKNVEKGFGELCEEFLGRAQWLTNVTASEGAHFIQSYSLVRPLQQAEEGSIQVSCSGFLSGQIFLARSENALQAVSGCKIESISKNYYKITAIDPYFEIKVGE